MNSYIRTIGQDTQRAPMHSSGSADPWNGDCGRRSDSDLIVGNIEAKQERKRPRSNPRRRLLLDLALGLCLGLTSCSGVFDRPVLVVVDRMDAVDTTATARTVPVAVSRGRAVVCLFEVSQVDGETRQALLVLIPNQNEKFSVNGHAAIDAPADPAKGAHRAHCALLTSSASGKSGTIYSARLDYDSSDPSIGFSSSEVGVNGEFRAWSGSPVLLSTLSAERPWTLLPLQNAGPIENFEANPEGYFEALLVAHPELNALLGSED